MFIYPCQFDVGGQDTDIYIHGQCAILSRAGSQNLCQTIIDLPRIISDFQTFLLYAHKFHTILFNIGFKATTGAKMLCLGPQIVALIILYQGIFVHGTYLSTGF